MDELIVTVVGTDLFKSVEKIFDELGMHYDDFCKGSIGNMKTVVYTFVIEQHDVIKTRKNLMKRLDLERNIYTPMYVHGDWMKIYIFRNIL